MTKKKRPQRSIHTLARKYLGALERAVESHDVTAAELEVVRKVLRDNDWIYGEKQKGQLHSMSRKLPTTDPERIPALGG